MKVESIEDAIKFFKRLGASVLRRESGFYLMMPHWNSGEIYSPRDLISFARCFGGYNFVSLKQLLGMRQRQNKQENPPKFESMRGWQRGQKFNW